MPAGISEIPAEDTLVYVISACLAIFGGWHLAPKYSPLWAFLIAEIIVLLALLMVLTSYFEYRHIDGFAGFGAFFGMLFYQVVSYFPYVALVLIGYLAKKLFLRLRP